jgi:hypothetical protein
MRGCEHAAANLQCCKKQGGHAEMEATNEQLPLSPSCTILFSWIFLTNLT